MSGTSHDRFDGTGSGSHPYYPLSWWEGGKHFFYDGDIEHRLSYAHPPRIIYTAADATDAEIAALQARWDRWGFEVKRKCP